MQLILTGFTPRLYLLEGVSSKLKSVGLKEVMWHPCGDPFDLPIRVSILAEASRVQAHFVAAIERARLWRLRSWARNTLLSEVWIGGGPPASRPDDSVFGVIELQSVPGVGEPTLSVSSAACLGRGRCGEGGAIVSQPELSSVWMFRIRPAVMSASRTKPLRAGRSGASVSTSTGRSRCSIGYGARMLGSRSGLIRCMGCGHKSPKGDVT